MAYDLAKTEISGAHAGFCGCGRGFLLSTTTTPATTKTATTV